MEERGERRGGLVGGGGGVMGEKGGVSGGG